MSLKQYPKWVCDPCGKNASTKGQSMTSTFHIGICEVCDQTNVPVTEPRDYFYPLFEEHERP